MPIAILEIGTPHQLHVQTAETLCTEAGNFLHETLHVPDEKDKAIRVVRNNLMGNVLRLTFTVGPNEYPGFEQNAFFPEKEEIQSAGQGILDIVNKSEIPLSRIVIDAWRNTTFVPGGEEAPEPTLPVPIEQTAEIGSRVVNPKIKLILGPQNTGTSSVSKELDSSHENGTYQEVATQISTRMAEILGNDNIIFDVEFADVAGSDISVEFDCEVNQDDLIPDNVRRYMAESMLQILDTSPSTMKGSCDVWIRQGEPERLEIYV